MSKRLVMKSKFLALISGLLTLGLQAQPLVYDWHFVGSGQGSNQLLSSVIDASGHSILVGNFEETLTVADVSLQADEFARNGFILKLDPSGALMWIRELEVDAFDDVYPFDVVLDTEGNILVAGSFRGSLDADPSEDEFMLTSEFDDIYLSKFDPEGNLIWAQTVRANNSEERILDLALGDDGALYMGGYIDFSPNRNNDIPFLGKVIPADTSLEWNYIIASEGRIDGINEIALHGNHLYCTGSFVGMGNFSSSPDHEVVLDAGAGEDLFVLKMTTDKDLVWAIHVGVDQENDDVVGKSIVVDDRGDVYVSGQYHGLVDFDPGAGVAELDGFANSFVLKLSPDGEFIWVRNDEASTNNGIVLNANNAPFSLFENSGDQSESLLNVRKFSPSGDSIWTSGLQGENIFSVQARGMQFDGDENILVGLNFWGAFNYDPNTSSSLTSTDDDWDFLYVKLNQDASTAAHQASISQIGTVYPNPVAEVLNLDFGSPRRQVDVQIRDLSGKTLSAHYYENVQTISMPFHHPSGHYYVWCSMQDGTRYIERIISQRMR